MKIFLENFLPVGSGNNVVLACAPALMTKSLSEARVPVFALDE